MSSNTEYLHDISLIFNLRYNRKSISPGLHDSIPKVFGLSKRSQQRLIKDLSHWYRVPLSASELPEDFSITDIMELVRKRKSPANRRQIHQGN